MEKKKIIKRVVFVVVVLLMLAKLMQMTFYEATSKQENEVKRFEVSQEDIISSGQEITIKSFEAIEDVKWLNNESLLIKGMIDGSEALYIFDLSSYELMLYKSEVHAPVSYDDYEIVKEIPEYGLLAIKGQSIGLIKDNAYKVILENITFEDDLKYLLSKDLTKLLMYHAEKETIVTYNFEKDFYRTIKAPINDDVLREFYDRVQISPIGGYVSIEYREEVLEDSYFKIYGADSGRLYAEDVFGVNLSWAGDDTKVCYFYAKEVEALKDNVFENMDFIGSRIGYYDVDKKKIDYIDVVGADEKMISEVFWSGHIATSLTGTVGETIRLKSVRSYDFDTDTYNEWLLDLDEFPLGTSIELLNDVDAFILLFDVDNNHKVVKVLKDSHEVVDYGDIKAFDTYDENNQYYYKSDDTFITADVVKITVSNGNSQGFIQLEDNAYKVIPNENMTYVGVWFTELSELKILNTK